MMPEPRTDILSHFREIPQAVRRADDSVDEPTTLLIANKILPCELIAA
jgi:hypothetical protein